MRVGKRKTYSSNDGTFILIGLAYCCSGLRCFSVSQSTATVAESAIKEVMKPLPATVFRIPTSPHGCIGKLQLEAGRIALTPHATRPLVAYGQLKNGRRVLWLAVLVMTFAEPRMLEPRNKRHDSLTIFAHGHARLRSLFHLRPHDHVGWCDFGV